MDFYALLCQAIGKSSTAWIEALADSGALLNDSPKFRLTPLAVALDAHCLDSFNALLGAGADPDSPFSWCAEKNAPSCLSIALERIDFARALVDAGCDIHRPNSRGWAPLSHAVWRDAPDVVALLLERGADPLADHGPGSPLAIAHAQQRSECLGVLQAHLDAREIAAALPGSPSARAPSL